MPTDHPTARRPRIGRPPKLDREAVLDAAVAIGLTTFTVAQLAEHLGVSEGAIYRHVRGTGDIVASASARLLTKVDTELAEVADWQDYLEAVCAQLRDHAVRTPGFGTWLVGGIYEDDTIAVFDRILDGLCRRNPAFDREVAYLVGSQAVACTVGLVASGFIGAVPDAPTEQDLDDQFRWMLRSLLRGMAAHLADGTPRPRSRPLAMQPSDGNADKSGNTNSG